MRKSISIPKPGESIEYFAMTSEDAAMGEVIEFKAHFIRVRGSEAEIERGTRFWVRFNQTRRRLELEAAKRGKSAEEGTQGQT